MGAEYEMIEYECTDGPEFSREAWFGVKNNLGLDLPNLPYLVEGDFKLTEGCAIHRYLAEKYKPELLGKDAKHRAQVAMLEMFINGSIKW